MILDGILLLILAIAAFLGRKTGAFRMVMRLAAFAVSWICMALWGGKMQVFFQKTGAYETLYQRLVSTLQGGESGTFFGAAQGQAAEMLARSMADSIGTAASFIIIWFLVRLLIWILDKTIFHLPVVRPVNAFLGIAVSLAITVIILYAVVGAVGNTLAFSEAPFWQEQMASSQLVRGMYEHNFVLHWLLKKG